MEKAAKADADGKGWEHALIFCTALVAGTMGPAAHAQEGTKPAEDVQIAQARVEPTVRMQVQTTALPRFDSQDAGFQAPRVDFSFTPLNSSGNGLGAVLGMASPAAGAQALGFQQRTTAVDVGLRWTQRLQSQRQIDVTAWRRMNNPDDAYTLIQMRQPVYGARLEMNLSARSPKSGFAIDRGFVGFQMEGGARITIKRKDGRPMVYYRTSF